MIRMHIFDYRFLRDSSVDPDVFRRVVNIERVRAGPASMLADDDPISHALESRAILMSVVDSNNIEGIFTSEERAVALIAGNVAPRGHDEKEIAGYRDALRYIHREHDSIRFDRESILEIYSILMSYRGDDVEPVFRKVENVIVDRDSDGNIVNMYPTVPASEVEYCIDQMVGAFWEVRYDDDVNDLLLIPCVIMDFLRIHPFKDGNGRMSRLLTTLLMYQSGYDVCRYVSMESKINSSKMDYYHALEESQIGWFDNSCDYTPFITYFLSQLFLCYRDLNRLVGENMGGSRKSDALESFLRICTVHVSKSDLCAMFPNISEITVSRVLRRMCDSGELRKVGGGRSTRYISSKMDGGRS